MIDDDDVPKLAGLIWAFAIVTFVAMGLVSFIVRFAESMK